MSEIVVVGSEDFTLGFELVGVKSHPLSSLESLISKNSDVGIIIISRKDYDSLSIKLKSIIDTLLRPIVVILSEDDVKGGNLREMIIKSLGVDLMK